MDKQHHQLRSALLELPGVKLGNRFGGEAFFVGKRFFCHFHPGGSLLLETFVWDNVDEVVSAIPGVIPHPQYGNYGWVRLRVSSSADLAKAKELVESSYRYMISTKRISLPKTEHVMRGVNEATKRFPKINFKTKQSRKRTQVLMEVQLFENASEAAMQLNQAAGFLKKF